MRPATTMAILATLSGALFLYAALYVAIQFVKTYVL